MLLATRLRKVLGALLLVVATCVQAVAQEHRSHGPDSVIVYNAERQPIRRIGTLPPITSCAATPSGQLYLADNRLRTVLIADSNGTALKTFPVYDPVRRIAVDGSGVILVLNDGSVGEFTLDGDFKTFVKGKGVSNAVRHPQDGFVGVLFSGEIVHFSWKGDVIAKFGSDVAGRAVSIVDIAFEDTSTLVALEAQSNEVIILDTSLKEARRFPSPFQNKEVSFIQHMAPFLAAVDTPQKVIRFFKSDGTSSAVSSQSKISCLAPLQNGDFLAAYYSGDKVYIPHGVYGRYDDLVPALSFDCVAAVVFYAIAFSSLFVWGWRWLPLRLGLSRQTRTELEVTPSACNRSTRRWPRFLLIAIFLASLGGLYLSYVSHAPLNPQWHWATWQHYWMGGVISSLCFLLLSYRGGLYAGLAPLRVPANALSGNSVSWFLLVLAAVCGVYAYRLNDLGVASKLILFNWFAAQVLFIGAFVSTSPKVRWSMLEKGQLFVILALGAFSRLYRWTDCPPDIHFDFGAFGDEAVRLLVDTWYPFFDLRAGQTIGRPWLLQTAAMLWIFGPEDWVIRIPSVVWSVGLILSAYLLGRETISHRFGLIFAILAGAQHSILGYSRLPYVTESTAPFIFCLYFVCRGLNRHSLRDWAIAGVWASWSMMTVRQFTTFPFIGAAILLYCAVVHWRSMWRHSAHLAVMALAIAITFSPFFGFYIGAQHLGYRLGGVSPLWRGDSFNPDLAAWISQFTAAFGGILRYPDRAPWPVPTSAPTCMAITGALFGCGLVILIVRCRSLAAPVALLSMSVSIALGSAFLANPPSYYHQFVGIVFVMYLVAVPLEGCFDAASKIKWRIVRWPIAVCCTGLLYLSAKEQVEPLIGGCSAPLNEKGVPKEKINLYSVLSKQMIAHRKDRFVSVSYGDDVYNFHHANLSLYYGQLSERHDVRTPISSYLPIRPTAKPQGLRFVMIEGFAGELPKIQAVYPVGQLEKFPYNLGLCEMLIYSVSAADAQSVYEEAQRSGKVWDSDFFALKPI
jgi:hypothetical protein